MVLKNDYQAHSISAANILISLFKSWQSTGKICFQYPKAYWEPRAFFSSLCNGSVTVAISVKRRSLLSKHLGKNGSSGQLTCTSTVLWSLNILLLTFLNCVFWSDCALFNSSFIRSFQDYYFVTTTCARDWFSMTCPYTESVLICSEIKPEMPTARGINFVWL